MVGDRSAVVHIDSEDFPQKGGGVLAVVMRVIAVAAITKRPHGFVLAHVEGAKRVTLNRRPVGDEPMAMKNGDVIELAGTQMEFLHY